MNESLLDTLIRMFPDVPFQKLLGIEIVEVVAERAVVCLPFRPDLAGGGNVFHGGAISSLLDLTGALAAWSGHNPENGMKAATVSMTVNYLAAAQGKDIIATANAVKRGRELIFSEVSIREKESRKLIANGSMIYRIT
ncbi:MAG: PaaI family thioesterase [Pseudomonadota bacterium]